jgi:manganese transport protein
MTFQPLIAKRNSLRNSRLHNEPAHLNNLSIKAVNKIAVALDFSENDEKLIAYAVAQGKKEAAYILLHIVESVSAGYLGKESDDDETRKDLQRLELYAQQLNGLGFNTEYELGYNKRIKEIVRIVKNTDADLLIMGAHRHKGLKDYLFGETIEDVRHELNIPVLIVNV